MADLAPSYVEEGEEVEIEVKRELRFIDSFKFMSAGLHIS